MNNLAKEALEWIGIIALLLGVLVVGVIFPPLFIGVLVLAALWFFASIGM